MGFTKTSASFDHKQSKLLDHHVKQFQRFFVFFTLKLEEQLSKVKSTKKSKKEIELSWDKERKDLHHSVQSMQIFIKDLQAQLLQRELNNTANSSLDNYYNNETLQSLNGENEFLKNRIKEVTIVVVLDSHDIN